uniref:Uncharacterized protein n=1 Tax=Arundo donax TaxID=35708 RepID=A0A0A8ZIM2_ARUDO
MLICSRGLVSSSRPWRDCWSRGRSCAARWCSCRSTTRPGALGATSMRSARRCWRRGTGSISASARLGMTRSW